MNLMDKYQIVVGLEVHAQLQTKSKLFCGDSIAFGAEPNTHVSPVTLAHPGTLPKTNKQAVEYAVRMGIACNCEIVRYNYFARKNYFYPDLPKGIRYLNILPQFVKVVMLLFKVQKEKNR